MEPCIDELIFEMAGSLNANVKDVKTHRSSEQTARHLFAIKKVNTFDLLSSYLE